MASFIFLEIVDREINHLLATMTEILTGIRTTEPAHLTVRGPYQHDPSEGTIRRLREQMRHDVLRIGGVGRFENPGEQVVFLRVDSPNLRRIWYKPDYPIGSYGFTPHISIYRGPDDCLAGLLEEFLVREDLVLHCAEFRLVQRLTRQGVLFTDEVPGTPYSFRASGLRGDFLDRLRAAVEAYRGQA